MSETPSRQKRKAQLAYATYRVLKAINEGKTQEYISNQILRINPSNTSRRCSSLVKQQLIVKDVKTSSNIWKLTISGKVMMQHLRNVFGTATLNDQEFPITFRWHHIIFKLAILRQPIDFPIQLVSNKFFYGRKAGFLYGWIKRFEDADIVFTKKSILIYPKPIEAGDVNSAIIKGCNQIDRITTFLLRSFPLLEIQSTTQICRQHCAMVGGITNFFPREYHYESDRLMIDCSTGVPEIEGINKMLAIQDMQVISQFLGMQKIKHKLYLSEDNRELLIKIVEFYMMSCQQVVIITLKDGTQEYSPEIKKLIHALGLNKEF